MREACENCRFWKRPIANLSAICRRFPEHIKCNASDWCGEWQSGSAVISSHGRRRLVEASPPRRTLGDRGG
jgi:hypothetical protein